MLLLESRSNVGGRCRTRYTRDGGSTVLYETGPWRLHESHTLLRGLLRDAGLKMIPSTPAKKGDEPDLPTSEDGDLSSWDVLAADKGAKYAREAEVATGYEGLLSASNSTNVYHAQRHEAGKYYAIASGFSSLVDWLKRRALDRGCEIRVKCRVTNVCRTRKSSRGFDISCSGGTRVQTKTIVCCVPPHSALHWTASQKWLLPHLHSVGSAQLNHVYAKTKRREDTPRKKSVSDSLLAQTIPGDYRNGWFQASYSSGNTALFWHRMAMRGNLLPALEKELGGIKLKDAKSHFWPHAVHYWKPMFGLGASIQPLVDLATEPHPTALPGMYWCGEAFSGVQGWVEGALETSNMVLRRIAEKRSYRRISHRRCLRFLDGKTRQIALLWTEEFST